MSGGIVNLAGRKGAAPSSAGPSTPPRASTPASSSAQKASSAAARGTSDKSVHDAKCGGLFGWFRRLALLDKALVVAVLLLVFVEGHEQYKTHMAKSEGDDSSSTTKSFQLGPGSWQARTLIVGTILAVFGTIAYCCVGCLQRRRRNKATAHLRVRGETGAPLEVGCCGKMVGFWKSLGMLDKLLLATVICFGGADLTIQAKDAGMGDKLQKLPSQTLVMLRGTPAPTPAPTPVPPEDLSVVVADMESKAGASKAAKPATCTEDDFTKIKASGMNGDACKGQPYTQACAISQLTKIFKPTWLTPEFAKEMVESHKTINDANITTTFFGIVLGEQFGDECSKVEEHLANILTDAAVKTDLLAKPKLLCNGAGTVKDDIKNGWGVQPPQQGTSGIAITDSSGLSGKTLDNFVRDADLIPEIKDYVHVGGATQALKDGLVTMARARYVSFVYDWQAYWASITLSDVVAKMDSAGHTCYWVGDDKLWRITDCWQDFYSYKTYGFAACVNRNLAPGLLGRMEAKFKATIGA